MARERRAVAVSALLVLVACGGDDSGADDDGDGSAATGGCPVAAAVVAAAVGHAVTVERGNGDVCAYVADDEGDAAGGRVEIQLLALADRPFADVLAEVEQRTGPAEVLGDDAVDHADRAWVAAVGRSVQVGAANDDDEALAVVAVTDPLLDALAAREVAIDLAGEALDR